MSYITLDGHTVPYTINQSPRLKRLSMRWRNSGELIVNQPRHISTTVVNQFLQQKAKWILKHYHRTRSTKLLSKDIVTTSYEHYIAYKKQSLMLCEQKVGQWSKTIPYEYNTIRVKQLSSKRGSCSSKKNLNFNYKILFLPEHLQDYLVVHEMCHLKEMNHSSRFRSLVEQYYGPWKRARRLLRSY